MASELDYQAALLDPSPVPQKSARGLGWTGEEMRTLVGEREMVFHACSGKTGVHEDLPGKGVVTRWCDEMPGNGSGR